MIKKKKSSDKILSVMDPVCLHHDMSGLGGWEGIGWNRVGVRVVGYEIRFYYCVRLLSFVFL